MNSNEQGNRLPAQLISNADKQEDNTTIKMEFQGLYYMQQAFKLKKWNYLQPGNEIEWMNITQDFLKNFPDDILNRNSN